MDSINDSWPLIPRNAAPLAMVFVLSSGLTVGRSVKLWREGAQAFWCHDGSVAFQKVVEFTVHNVKSTRTISPQRGVHFIATKRVAEERHRDATLHLN